MGAGDGSAGDAVFRPNVLVGMLPGTNWQAPAIAIGLNDFVIEFWLKTKYSSAGPTMDAWNRTGALDVVVGGGATTDMYCVYHGTGNNVEAEFDQDGVAGGLQTGTPWSSNARYGWQYVVANYDRSANLQLYINTIADATALADISAFVAVNLGNQLFYPNLYEISNPNFIDEAGVGLNNRVILGVVGPFAVHVNTLLTAAQMAESYTNRGVQQIAQTQVRYDYRDVTATGWEARRNRMLTGMIGGTGAVAFTVKGVDIPVAAPEGAAGAVLIPDLSGNGNDLTVPSATSYGTGLPAGGNAWPVAATDKAQVVFGSDPFFV